MKINDITFNTTSTFFFTIEDDICGQAEFRFLYVMMKHDIIKDIEIELDDLWAFKEIDGKETEHFLNSKEVDILTNEVKMIIMRDPEMFNAHEFISEDDQHEWHLWHEYQLQQYLDDRL